MNTGKTKKLKKLAAVLTTFKKPEQMVKFLRDLCSLEELDELSRRKTAIP